MVFLAPQSAGKVCLPKVFHFVDQFVNYIKSHWIVESLDYRKISFDKLICSSQPVDCIGYIAAYPLCKVMEASGSTIDQSHLGGSHIHVVEDLLGHSLGGKEQSL